MGIRMEKWISVKQASELLKLSEREIRNIAHNGKFVFRYIPGSGRGGRKLEIQLSSLPEEAQARYAGLEPCYPELETLPECNGKQRENADFKRMVVRDYQRSGLSPEAFTRQFNERNPPEDAISVSQLFRWQKKLKEGGPAALIDHRGGYNKGRSSVPEEAWGYFYSLYMTQQKRGIQVCYDYTKAAFPDIPGISAFRRRVKEIPLLVLIKYREGEDAFRNATPCMERDKTDIRSNDIWYSDHHHIDVFTRSPEGPGKICRLWLTVFFDARSNKVISYICREADPNATVIKQCLKKGIETCGVPRELYFDNGKDYRSKFFNRDFPMSIYNQLGIGQIYATPYLGRAKTVERFFKTFEERFGKMFPTYTGKDAKNRPEQMRISNEKIYTYAVDTETFLSYLDEYIDTYNHTPSRGSGLEGKCPDEIYYMNLDVKREITDRRALALLCGTFETRTVNRNGITFKGRTYASNALLPHYKEKVIVNYTPDNMDVLHVFDSEMNAICTAAAKLRTPFRNTTEEDYQKAVKARKRARKMVEEYRPQTEQNIFTAIAQSQQAEKLKEEAGRPAAVERVAPKIDTEAFEAKVLSREERKNVPDLVSILSQKYAEELKQRTGGF